MTGGALVGPLQKVHFHDGTVIGADVPRNTTDSRYPLCTDHHLGCICREAELNEDIGELRAIWREAVEASKQILAGHPTFPENGRWVRSYWVGDQLIQEFEYDESVVCQCTGCQITRKAYLR